MHANLQSPEPRSGLAVRMLVGAAVGSLVLAGVVLWSHRGDAVFSDVVLAALAWCF
jgi:hypothetical protein